MHTDTPITELVHEWQDGNREALDELVGLVYTELKAMSARELRRGWRKHTLDPTSLVNELYIRLLSVDRITVEDRTRFQALVARLMRNILIDHVRRRDTQRRGGDLVQVDLDLSHVGVEHDPINLVDLDRVLTKLEAIDAKLVRLVELRFFAGLTERETAEVLGVSRRKVQRDWKFAKQWLANELGNGGN